MNNENIPQSMNKEQEEIIVQFWKEGNVSASLRFKCHNWFISPDNNKFIIVNHFQYSSIVNMTNYDYMETFK